MSLSYPLQADGRPKETQQWTKQEVWQLVRELVDLHLPQEEKNMSSPTWSQANEVRQAGRWSAGRIPNYLTNRQGIQWPVASLTDRMLQEIAEDDPSLLEDNQ